MYLDYLPFFNTVTKQCKGLGQEGEEILRSGLKSIRVRALEAHAKSDARTSNELPHVNVQKGKAKRMTKQSSPTKNQRR